MCLLGTHGAGKTTCGRWLADKLGIFHIQFEEHLQEMIMPKTQKRVGLEFDEEPEEDQIDMETLFQELGNTSQTNTETESESAHENENNKNKEVLIVINSILFFRGQILGIASPKNYNPFPITVLTPSPPNLFPWIK